MSQPNPPRARYLVGAIVAATLGIGAGFAAGGTNATPMAPPMGMTTLKDAEGKTVGTATVRETPKGVLLSLDLTAAPTGMHALHLHTTGKCEGPKFETAGGHFNPQAHAHGYMTPQGGHLGDLPNVYVPADKQTKVELFAEGVKLSGGAHPLLDKDGASLVLHATLDDYKTDPAGNAGGRIACGVIQLQK